MGHFYELGAQQPLPPGTRVRVAKGYFTGQKGTVRELKTEDVTTEWHIVEHDDGTVGTYRAHELVMLH